MSSEGKGRPVELRTCSRLVDVDPSSGTATLESGEKVQGDVVIGADGVHVSAPHRDCEIHPTFEDDSLTRV